MIAILEPFGSPFVMGLVTITNSLVLLVMVAVQAVKQIRIAPVEIIKESQSDVILTSSSAVFSAVARTLNEFIHDVDDRRTIYAWGRDYIEQVIPDDSQAAILATHTKWATIVSPDHPNNSAVSGISEDEHLRVDTVILNTLALSIYETIPSETQRRFITDRASQHLAPFLIGQPDSVVVTSSNMFTALHEIALTGQRSS